MKVNGYRADDLARVGLITRERWVMPLWMSLTGVCFRALWRALVWLIRRGAITGPALLLVIAYFRWDWPGPAALLTGAVLFLVAWWLAHPASFKRVVGARLLGQWRLMIRYRRLWRPAMIGGQLAVVHDEKQYLPVIRRVRSTRWADELRVRLLYGQTPERFALVAENLRHVFGAYRCTARELKPGVVTLRFYHRDPLATPLGPLPMQDFPDLRRIELGRTEDAVPFLLALLGTHVLVAGASGAGKGSVLWSLIRALAPLVAQQSVELWVIDPKGGMEMTFGKPLFARYEDTDAEAMAELLEEAAERMQARTQRLKGVTRLHTPSPGDPLIVVLVDELAALTAYLSDRKLRDRIKAALSLLLSQGRAPGFLVVAAVQDPRKDVVPFRDLFPTRIALRLTEAEQVDMVLGDGARDRGALCDRIPRALPGVAYVRLDDDPDPVRVRFGYPDDDAIAETCQLYAPNFRPQILPDDAQEAA
ncbi:FtsK/SpoIIIE domain-containing protein [Cryptosporangium japonicum]|uniref:FtsK/SpoIIIE domain-containing protein n=2 Tax=Cryptosporangium japonicum TaxID=80872 RepID=A0ABN0V379_9ACTN